MIGFPITLTIERYLNPMMKPLSILFLLTLLVSACRPQLGQSHVSTGTPAETRSLSQTPMPAPQSAPTLSPAASKAAPTTAATPLIVVQPIMGIHIHDLKSQAKMSLFEDAGGYWTRFDGFHWDLIEPVESEKPVYQWDKVDVASLDGAVNARAQIIAIVNFAPAWAQKYPGVACGPFAEAALGKFASFMNALVSRYSQPPYNIKYWEIGNEPDVDRTLVDPHSAFGCWGDQNDPYYGGGYYGEMLAAAYNQIKRADPQAHVLIGGLLLDCDPINPPEIPKNSGQFKNCTASRFLEGILKNGGGDYFDGVSFHAYDYYSNRLGRYSNPNWHSAWNGTGPVLNAKVDYLRSLLASHGYDDKFLINTEVALLCGRDGTESQCQSEDFALTKAYYLSEANAAAKAQGLYANIWYSLTGWRASGLVDGSLKPNLAYDAYKFNAAQLKGVTFVADVTGYTGVKGYEFNKEGKRIWLLWSADGNSHTIQPATLPIRIFDAFGKTIQAEKVLTITAAPLYLEWQQ
jgi:hypothetical protein